MLVAAVLCFDCCCCCLELPAEQMALAEPEPWVLPQALQLMPGMQVPAALPTAGHLQQSEWLWPCVASTGTRHFV
jgi:hypothetical protein